MNKITQLLTISLLLCGAGVVNAVDLKDKACLEGLSQELVEDCVDSLTRGKKSPRAIDLFLKSLEEIKPLCIDFAQCKEGKDSSDCAERVLERAFAKLGYHGGTEFERCNELDKDESSNGDTVLCNKLFLRFAKTAAAFNGLNFTWSPQRNKNVFSNLRNESIN